jgi:hypothetical protein
MRSGAKWKWSVTHTEILVSFFNIATAHLHSIDYRDDDSTDREAIAGCPSEGDA